MNLNINDFIRAGFPSRRICKNVTSEVEVGPPPYERKIEKEQDQLESEKDEKR